MPSTGLPVTDAQTGRSAPPAAAPPAQLFAQGVALHQQGRLDAAQVLYEQALSQQPDNPDALHLLGVIAAQSAKFDVAVDLIGKAIKIDPANPDPHLNIGLAFAALKKFGEAVVSFDRFISLRPGHAEAHSNRGNALQELKQLKAAVASFDEAIRIQPGCALAHYNRGNARKELQQLDDAVRDYDEAIRLDPGYALAYWNKSLALLLAGHLEAGWPLYEWRWKSGQSTPRSFAQPLLPGAGSAEGKTVLLHCEQGLGDIIQFCRYAQSVTDLGARVVLEVPRPLMGLMKDLGGVAELLERGKPLPRFDYHCPLMSLPLVMNTRLDNIPSASAYLSADAAKVRAWADRLGPAAKLRVGIVWSGSPLHKSDSLRSLALERLLTHLPDSCDYFSLQTEVRDSDRAALAGGRIRHVGEAIADLADTAALCELMDVVVSVDTSVAHLAAALGRSTWIMLPYAPDWRWLLKRSDSPWYRSATLYRQNDGGDWGTVLERIGADLADRARATQDPSA